MWVKKKTGRIIGFSAAAGAAALLFLYLANPAPLEDAKLFPTGVILRDREDQILRVGLGPGDQDCRPTYRPSADDCLVKAVVAAEDRSFWRHSGVDAGAILRASWLNVSHGRVLSGASTITMQTIRLIRPRKRTLWAKLSEAVQALRLERAMSKEEIMFQYLNRAPFGSNLVGAEAAAWGWFGKPPRELHLGEAALLAGILQSPTRFRPDRFPDRAKGRRAYVLDRMETLGMITAEERARAEKTPIRLTRAPRPFKEPYFCDWAQRLCPKRSGVFTTTLDSTFQRQALAALDRQAAALKTDLACVVLEVKTGAVRVMACTGDYFSPPDGQVNTATSPRPAGSTLKPFVFGLALDGGLIAPRTMLADVPMTFGNEAPQNFSGTFLGPVSAREALILSLNLPAIDLERRVGQKRFYGTLHRLGFSSLDRPAAEYGLGLVLGNGSVSLVDLCNAYACLARGGAYHPVSPFAAGTNAVRNVSDERPVFSEASCWLVSEMLSGGERALSAIGHQAETRVPRFAWKTGTSSGYRDAWTVAWNPEYVVGVWCGFKSGQRSLGLLVGKKAAAPVVWEIIRMLYPSGEGPWFRRPDDIEERETCALSGADPTPWCDNRAIDFAIRQRTSHSLCALHSQGPDGKPAIRWPADIATFFQKNGTDTKAIGSTALRITSPSDKTTFRLVDGISQRIPFETEGVGSDEKLWWFCDGALAGETVGCATWFWEPAAGRHRIRCATADGEAATVSINVQQ